MRAQLVLISAVALLAACSNSEETKTAANGEPAAATPAALTAPAPGLWQQTVSGAQMPQPMTVKICVGETAPGANPFNTTQPGVTCSENTVKSTPGGAEFHAVCNAQGMTVTSDGKVTGDMRTAYKVDITTKTSGANVPAGMADMTMSVDAKRLGDCPAGVAPNAVVQ